MNQKDTDEWYPMNQPVPPMKKKRRIALLEKQVADLQERLATLEARLAVPIPPMPWTQPWTPGTGSPPWIPPVTC